jgi:hypothetical protein
MPSFDPSEPLVVAHGEDIARAVDLLKRKGNKIYEFNPAYEGKTGATEFTFASRFPDREIWMTFSFGEDHTELHLSFPVTPLGVQKRVTRLDANVHLTRGDTDFDALIKKISAPGFRLLFGVHLNKTQSYTLARIAKTEPDYPKIKGAYDTMVSIIGGAAPDVEDMHTMRGFDESVSEASKMSPAEKAYLYVVRKLKKRSPKYEPVIMTEPRFAAAYAKVVLQKRWPEAEPIIVKEPLWAVPYAERLIKKRWPRLERRILDTSPGVPWAGSTAVDYAEEIIKGRWPELETNKHFLHDLYSCYKYATLVLHARFRPGEEIIKESPYISTRYAEEIFGVSEKEAEERIKSPEFASAGFDIFQPPDMETMHTMRGYDEALIKRFEDKEPPPPNWKALTPEEIAGLKYGDEVFVNYHGHVSPGKWAEVLPPKFIKKPLHVRILQPVSPELLADPMWDPEDKEATHFYPLEDIGKEAVPDVETMHTFRGYDERRLTESAWKLTPENLGKLKSLALPKNWAIGGEGSRYLQIGTELSIPSREKPVFLEMMFYLEEEDVFSLDRLRALSISVKQNDAKPKEFSYDFYASINPIKNRWMISPLSSKDEVSDNGRNPDFEKLLTAAPNLLKAVDENPAYFTHDKGKYRRELRQILRTVKHLLPYAPLLKEMFDFVTGGPVFDVEDIHLMRGYDESRLTETWAVPLANRKRAEEWARKNFPKEFEQESLFRKGETESTWYEFTFDWGRATDTRARVEIYFGQEEIHLVFRSGYPGPDYASAPDNFEDYLTKIGAASEVESIPGKVYRRMKAAYEGFLAVLRPPPDVENMHTLRGYDEARVRRYPTTDFSEMTNRDWRRIGQRASAIDPRIVFHEQSGRITLYRAEGDPGFNIALTPLPVNFPKILEIRVELEVDKPPEYLHEETIVLPDDFPVTFEGITGNERLAEGREIWPEIVRLFKDVQTPDVEDMHTFRGFDENVGRVIAGDTSLLERRGEETLEIEPRNFKATYEWANASLASDTIRVAGRPGETLGIKIPSTLFPEGWITMWWILIKTSVHTFARFELTFPRGKSSASSRSFSGRIGPTRYTETEVSFAVTAKELTFEEALTEFERALIRPVTINSLRKLRKKEPNLGKVSQLYNEIHRRLFVVPPEIETMHTFRGYDESITPEQFDNLKPGDRVHYRGQLYQIVKRTFPGSFSLLAASVKGNPDLNTHYPWGRTLLRNQLDGIELPPPDVDTMHTMRGYDESLLKEAHDYDENFPEGDLTFEEFNRLEPGDEFQFLVFDARHQWIVDKVARTNRIMSLQATRNWDGVEATFVWTDAEHMKKVQPPEIETMHTMRGYDETKARYLPAPEEGYPVDPETLKDVVAWARSVKGVEIADFESWKEGSSPLVQITYDTGEGKMQLVFYKDHLTVGYFFFSGTTLPLRLYGETVREPLNSLPALIDQQALFQRNRFRKFKFALPPLAAFYTEIVRRLFHPVIDVEDMHTMRGFDESVKFSKLRVGAKLTNTKYPLLGVGTITKITPGRIVYVDWAGENKSFSTRNKGYPFGLRQEAEDSGRELELVPPEIEDLHLMRDYDESLLAKYN